MLGIRLQHRARRETALLQLGLHPRDRIIRFRAPSLSDIRSDSLWPRWQQAKTWTWHSPNASAGGR
jgi:hypothetical protein